MRPGQVDENQDQPERARPALAAAGCDLYVPGLIEGAFGSRRWMQQIGKLGARAAVR